MQSLQAAIGRELRWRPRSPFSSTYDLVDPANEGGDPFATLVRRPGFLLRRPADVQSGDGAWRFQRRGLARGRVLVLVEGQAEPVAELRRYWRRAVIRLEDGGTEFTWRRESLWGRSWRFEDANGVVAVRLRLGLWPPAGSARVEIESSVAGPRERALLVCLAWYLALMERSAHAARTAP